MRALVSFGVGFHAELLEIAKPSFKVFADRHGYDLIIPDDPVIHPGRHPSWSKTLLMIEVLQDYDEVLWVDSDIVIVDSSLDLNVPERYWQALVRHHTEEGEVPNCGFWFVRRAMTPILERIWGMEEHLCSGWYEQSAMLELLGYNPFERPVQVRQETELYERTYFLGSGFNIHKRDRVCLETQRAKHATMHDNMADVMRIWAKEAKDKYAQTL